MLKKILAFVVMLYATVAFAAVDVNKATAAELDGVKGIGPAISAKIVDERKKGNFKDWNDFVNRVSGIGEKSAAKLSEGGLTVGGASFKGMTPTAAPAAKKDEKPAAAAKEEKKDPKAEAKAKKEAEKKAKEDAKKAKDAKPAAKDEKKSDAKADAAKPAASAAKK